MTTPSEEPSSGLSGWKVQEFLKMAEARAGSVGALLELGRAHLWRVDSYTADDWGVRIKVTNLPMPGFSPSRNNSAELSSIWDMFSEDEGRWQMRYGWKFLFGDEEVESAIAAGAEAAARGLLLTASHVLIIFRWRASLERRREENSGDLDFASFLDSIFKTIPQLPPLPPIPPRNNSHVI